MAEFIIKMDEHSTEVKAHEADKWDGFMAISALVNAMVTARGASRAEITAAVEIGLDTKTFNEVFGDREHL